MTNRPPKDADILTFTQAAEWFSRNWPLDGPVSAKRAWRSLHWHTDKGDLKPLQERGPRGALQVTGKELKRFARWLADPANRRRPGPARMELPASVRSKVGQVSDRAAARQAGVAHSVITRWRKRNAVPPQRELKYTRLRKVIQERWPTSVRAIAREAGVAWWTARNMLGEMGLIKSDKEADDATT